jgi:hypothetical protein
MWEKKYTRIAQMLDAPAIAFLVLTAEDETADGKVQARMNVIHEAGLFQGRLGFNRANRDAGGWVRGVFEHSRARATAIPERQHKGSLSRRSACSGARRLSRFGCVMRALYSRPSQLCVLSGR